jgi:hypothetical protein
MIEMLAIIGAFTCLRWLFRMSAALRENRNGYSGRYASDRDLADWKPPTTGTNIPVDAEPE